VKSFFSIALLASGALISYGQLYFASLGLALFFNAANA